MSIETEIRMLEEQLLQPAFRRNRAAVSALLADGFREFGSSGRVWAKEETLDALKIEPPFDATIAEFQAIELAARVVLVTYTVTLRLSKSDSRTSLRSSIWIKRNDRWRIQFHQGTLTSESWSKYLESGQVASPEFMDGVEDLPPQERDLWKDHR